MSNQDVYAPCHCGSGKKHKFCCLKKDREAGVGRSQTNPSLEQKVVEVLSDGSKIVEFGGATYRTNAELDEQTMKMVDAHFRKKDYRKER